MEDQGEKIVFLAREILNAQKTEEPVKSTTNVTMTFKTLCLTTLLAASSGGLVAAGVQAQTRPLTRYEKVELQALTFYAAKLKGLNEELLRQEVEQAVGVASLDELTAHDFPTARLYLQRKAQ